MIDIVTFQLSNSKDTIGEFFIAIRPTIYQIIKSCARHEPVHVTMTALITGLIAFTLWYFIWGRKGE